MTVRFQSAVVHGFCRIVGYANDRWAVREGVLRVLGMATDQLGFFKIRGGLPKESGQARTETKLKIAQDVNPIVYNGMKIEFKNPSRIEMPQPLESLRLARGFPCGKNGRFGHLAHGISGESLDPHQFAGNLVSRESALAPGAEVFKGKVAT